MKRTLAVLVVLLAFTITPFAFGGHGVSAQGFPDDPPELAPCGGLASALDNALPAPDPVPVGHIVDTVTGAFPGDCGF